MLSRYLKIKLCHFAFVFALSQFFCVFRLGFFFAQVSFIKLNSEKGIINGESAEVMSGHVMSFEVSIFFVVQLNFDVS